MGPMGFFSKPKLRDVQKIIRKIVMDKRGAHKWKDGRKIKYHLISASFTPFTWRI